MCNPGFVPAGRMRAVCAADGSWTSDPAALVCTCEIFIISSIHFTSMCTCISLLLCAHRYREGLKNHFCLSVSVIF